MKYTLEVELEDDNKCFGCPCLRDAMYGDDWYYCDSCGLSERNGVPDSRPKECPLKLKWQHPVNKLKEIAQLVRKMDTEEFIKRLDPVNIGDAAAYSEIEHILKPTPLSPEELAELEDNE